MPLAQRNVNMPEAQNLSKDWMCIVDIGVEDFRGAGEHPARFLQSTRLTQANSRLTDCNWSLDISLGTPFRREFERSFQILNQATRRCQLP